MKLMCAKSIVSWDKKPINIVAFNILGNSKINNLQNKNALDYKKY